jgi:hypothetical protein
MDDELQFIARRMQKRVQATAVRRAYSALQQVRRAEAQFICV